MVLLGEGVVIGGQKKSRSLVGKEEIQAIVGTVKREVLLL